MHRSRLAGFIIDCQTVDLEGASRFWSRALGLNTQTSSDPADEGYTLLDPAPGGIYAQVQVVSHTSRVHLDIETDDVAAEVRRLEGLGARRVESVRDWVIMQAPTGQRFCVVPAASPDFESLAHEWR